MSHRLKSCAILRMLNFVISFQIPIPVISLSYIFVLSCVSDHDFYIVM